MKNFLKGKVSSFIALTIVSMFLISIFGISLKPGYASDLDTIPPAASITSPTSGSQVGGVQTITVNATDNVGVVKVDYLLDGQLLGSSSSTPFSYNWDTNATSLGNHILTAKAYDAAGNVGTSAPVTVTVIAMPTATITSPTEGQYLRDSVNVIGTATASTLNYYNLEYSSQTTPSTWDLVTSSTVQVNSASLGTWDTTGIGDGVYNLRLTVTDTSGLVSTSVVNGVIVDNTLPTANISGPVANASVNGTVDIIGTAADTNFNSAKVEYGTGPAPTSWTQIASLTGSVNNNNLATWDTTRILDGTYTLRLTVNDKAGNTTSSQLSVEVKNMHSGTASYKYDGLNRLVQVTYTSGETVNYSYDAAGNLLSVTRTP